MVLPRRPTVHLVSVGDELLNGRTVDTNAAHLARILTDRGLRVLRTTVTGDGLEGIVAALAAETADLVLVTGGLGPTDDDRTREAVARHLGVALVEDPAAWRAIRARWRRLRPGQEPSPSNRRQALVPVGGEALANDRGTAPGLLARHGHTWIACLPGVPHEMRAMADRLVRRLPRLLPRLPEVRVAELYLAGIGESALQELLPGQFDSLDPQLGVTVSEAGHLVLRAVGSPAAVRAKMAALRRVVAPWRLPAPGIAPSLVQHLTRAGLTITTAESCTVGLVAAALGAVPGASAVLREALVAYAPEVKARRLGVPAAGLRHVVSQACVEAMARGARRRTGADLAVATTGIAGPGGGTAEVPSGTVWIAVAGPKGVQARMLRIDGDRGRVQHRAAAEALLQAWHMIINEWPATD